MDNGLRSTIEKNLSRINTRIESAASRSGRDPGEIEVVAVTKQKSAVVVKTLLELGVRQIGESYLKEALFKIDLLKDYDVSWHMIGNIQRGKEKQIARSFDAVHSVSNLLVAQKLNQEALKINSKLPVYLELNVSGERTKHGWPASDGQDLHALLPDVEEILGMRALQVVGLMVMAPYSDSPEDSRPYFRRLREVKDQINQSIPDGQLTGLSMGMSGDFEVAIEEGATVLRIGSALVGPRT